MMKPQRLLWHLYGTFLLLTLGAIITVTWYISGTLHDFHITQIRQNLIVQAHLVVDRVTGKLDAKNSAELDLLSKHLGELTGTRITLILPDGKVIADSEELIYRMDNHAGRPEIAAALSGVTGVSTRFSQTLQQTLMYVAVPVYSGKKIAGSVRTALSIATIEEARAATHRKIIVASGGIAIIAALFSLWLARRISQPLESMRRGAERFALGEFDTHLTLSSGVVELTALSGALNNMAGQLEQRFQSIKNQRNELDAVLSSMIEAVIAVDRDEHILRLNPAAARLFGVQQHPAINRPVQEVLRKATLQQFIRETLAAEEPLERDLTLLVDGVERHLQTRGTALKNSRNERIGALIVISDVTRLRRLENLRRDFVANVSHELKTPITAIRGWAETLRHNDPETHEKAIDVILRQSDRLNDIFNDLLDLSRLEEEQERSAIALQPVLLPTIFESVVTARSVELREKDLVAVVQCDPRLKVNCNPLMLEQAVANLLGNAIKYSPAGRRIILSAERSAEQIVITVEDFGCGIPNEHLPRLFERFYRVDPARSRALGGTGLGLAIVKHIAQIHGGSVEAQSSVGEGSTFSIILPIV